MVPFALGLVLLAPGIATSAAAEASCSAVVVVSGPERLRRPVLERLRSDGIDGSGSAGCPTTAVHLDEEGSEIRVEIIDGYGRRSNRLVSGPEAAIPVIESRARTEMVASLLRVPADDARALSAHGDLPEARGVEERAPIENVHRKVGAAHATVAPTDALAVVAPAAAASSDSGRQLSFATEVAAGSDHSAWLGLTLAGCVDIGIVCVGTTVRLRRDLDSDDDKTSFAPRRSAADILLTGEVPFRLGPLRLRPGAELGLGWVHMWAPGASGLPADKHELDHGGLLGGLHVTASLPISAHWSVDLTAGNAISFFAHTDSFVDGGFTLPGEPRALLRTSLGLRYGEP